MLGYIRSFSPSPPCYPSILCSWASIIHIFGLFSFAHQKRINGICWEHFVALPGYKSGNKTGVTSLRPPHSGKRETMFLTTGCALAPTPTSPGKLLAQRKTGRWINESILLPKRGHKYDLILWFQDTWPSQAMAKRSFHKQNSWGSHLCHLLAVQSRASTKFMSLSLSFLNCKLEWR